MSSPRKRNEMQMLERDIEKILIREVRKAGGLCLKFVSPGWSGAPDRLCLFPGGRILFVELKRPGGKVRPLQERRAEQLRELGFNTVVVDSMEGIEKFLLQYSGGDALDKP